MGGEALLATGVKGAMFAKKMRARKSRYKSVASHPYGPVEAKNNALVEEKLDRLIALVRINTQLAMHDVSPSKCAPIAVLTLRIAWVANGGYR